MPFSKTTCWAINRQLAGFWWGLVAWTMEEVIGIKITMVGDALPMNEDAIILPNHQSSSDIPALLWLARKKGMVGNIKWFVKDEIK
jgi:1-acyl-sn-glycerol-3-phosphate acyltransferase